MPSSPGMVKAQPYRGNCKAIHILKASDKDSEHVKQVLNKDSENIKQVSDKDSEHIKQGSDKTI
jgi:hypothetical protein